MGCAALVLASCGSESAKPPATSLLPPSTQPAPTVTRPSVNRRPNIVFVLTDDLSLNLLRFMPHVRAMEQQGMTFENYFVSDSLCCPSRASIFTGQFPHNTGVYGNFGPRGGFREFYRRGEEQHTFALALQRQGYLTAMMGKYLNGYMEEGAHQADGTPTNVPPTYVPPGWNRWDVAGFGYPEFDYTLNANGRLERYGHRRADYLTDVLAQKALDFIGAAATSQHPFFLELATFAPHSPFVPAPRNAHDFPGLRAPRPPSFDVLPNHAPRWLAAHPPLTARQRKRIDYEFRRRAQSVEAVDRMIGEIEHELRSRGLAQDTYVVFSSDNGLHTGEFRLMPGKLTAFDTDIHVPLILTGPGVPPGSRTPDVAENVDLAETFAAIAGGHMQGDGRSLLPLLHGRATRHWRTAALVEHKGGLLSVLDPDFQPSASGSPTSYEAIRTRGFIYVEYADGEREYYDLRRDPFELNNIAYQLSAARLRHLHHELARITSCRGRRCWAAMQVGGVPGL